MYIHCIHYIHTSNPHGPGIMELPPLLSLTHWYVHPHCPNGGESNKNTSTNNKNQQVPEGTFLIHSHGTSFFFGAVRFP